jgi:hypothetical protein
MDYREVKGNTYLVVETNTGEVARITCLVSPGTPASAIILATLALAKIC